MRGAADGVDLSVERLDVPSGSMGVVRARPADASPGAVVLLHEAYGLNDYITGVATRLCRSGFDVVAPEIFHRAGGGTAPYDDFGRARKLFRGLDDAGFLEDFAMLLDDLGDRGFAGRDVAVVGFSLGGRFSFLLALEHSLGAAVTYCGPAIVTPVVPERFPSLIGRCREMRSPWLGFFGEADPSIPGEDVDRLAAAIGEAPVPTELLRFPGASHGFHCWDRRSYDEESAGVAWGATLRWLERHMGEDGGGGAQRGKSRIATP